MKTRIIQTQVWIDGYFLKLTLVERYLFVYFLINPHVNIIWTYECPTDLIALETGVDQQTIEKIKQKFETDGKLFFYKDYVHIKNALKYEAYTGPTLMKAKGKLFNQFSKDVLDWYESISDTPIPTPLIPPITHNLEPSTNKEGYKTPPTNEDVNPEDIPF